jgi:hypothetical protein
MSSRNFSKDLQTLSKTYEKPEYGLYHPIRESEVKLVVAVIEKKQSVTVDVSQAIPKEIKSPKILSYVRTSPILDIIWSKDFLEACQTADGFKKVQGYLTKYPNIANTAFTVSHGRSGLHKSAQSMIQITIII